MTNPSITGSFSPGFFIPHVTQEYVGSGLPEWTLGDAGLPPTEPTEDDGINEDTDSDNEDSEDEGSVNEHIGDDGYDADDEGNDDSDDEDNEGCNVVDDDDDDDYAEDYERFLSTLPVGSFPLLDEHVGEQAIPDDDDYSKEYEHFLSTIPVGGSPTLDESVAEEDPSSCSDDSDPPSLSSDSGVWTLVSDSATTEDESIDGHLENVAIRSTSPDLHEALGGLALGAHGQRIHRPRSRIRTLGPDFETRGR